MSDASNSSTKGLRERLAAGTEDKLGKALADLLDSPLLTGTIGRAFDSREKVAQAQELAMGVLNLPSAADVERLTRRLRSVSQRLEGIEDGVHRLDRATVSRLSSIEDQLGRLATKLEARAQPDTPSPSAPMSRPGASGTAPKPSSGARKAASKPRPGASGTAPKPSSGARKAASKPSPKRPPTTPGSAGAAGRAKRSKS
jgi:hypothetical protein